MDRRDFLALAGAGAAAAGAASFLPGAKAVAQAASASPSRAAADRMKVGCQRWGSSPEKLPFLLRCGVRHICVSPAKSGPDGIWTEATCRERLQQVRDAGLKPVSMYWGVQNSVLVPERRDGAIARLVKTIEAAGAAGVPCLAYNLHVRVWRARTGHAPGRGGSQYSEWKLDDVSPQKKPDIGPCEPDEMWNRIAYFLERVVPAAEKAKVRLACHPPDPPMPKPNPYGIAQVLDTVEGLKRFVQTCDSPYHGLTFCQGCIWEMLPEAEKPEGLYDAIRWFGSRGKIFQVHFRNLRGGRAHFAETYHDEGEIDMVRAARTYKEVGYTGILMPDHLPGHEDDPGGMQAFAWAYGYIKGILHAVEGYPGTA